MMGSYEVAVRGLTGSSRSILGGNRAGVKVGAPMRRLTPQRHELSKDFSRRGARRGRGEIQFVVRYPRGSGRGVIRLLRRKRRPQKFGSLSMLPLSPEPVIA